MLSRSPSFPQTTNTTTIAEDCPRTNPFIDPGDMDDMVTGTAPQPVPPNARQENGDENQDTEATEEEIHDQMRNLLKEWVELTESEEDQKKIGLDEQSADELFRSVAEVKGKKRLFVCCDGTLQNAAGTIRPMSNVAKLARSIDRIGRDGFDCGTLGGVPQLAYYSGGIGSNSIVGVDGLVAATTGKGFTSTVLNAYCFISNNYNGSSLRDDIILVGYSRGAFAMRCLAQFISDVGLLRRSGLPHLGLFWKLWLSDEKSPGEDEPKWETMQDELAPLFFKEAKIKVLAEWDPVKSLIWPSLQGKKRLANMTRTVPQKVENAFVAISLHEKRWSYKPVVWEKYKEDQEVSQCAFLGSHSDVGGGNVDAGLSTISLYWMVAKIENACRASFNSDVLLRFIMPERVRTAPRITRPIGKRETFLTTQALSEGNVNNPSVLWQLPRLISFGLCFNGNRRRLLESSARPEGEWDDPGTQQCELKIHKTVHWITQRRDSGESPSALNGFTYEGVGRWKSRNGTYLREADLERRELKLATRWVEVAEKAQSSLNYLREKKREEARRDRNMTTENADIDGGRTSERPPLGQPLLEQPPLENQEDTAADEDMAADEEIFDAVKDWRRWRGAVNSEDTMRLETALIIKYLKPFLEEELRGRQSLESLYAIIRPLRDPSNGGRTTPLNG